MKNPIGGYFSLELAFYDEYHKDALRLNTGRNCLEYILRVRQYKKVMIPYYTCDSILEPFNKLNVDYDFYHINIDLELEELPNLQGNEALLYTNYFGLKQRYVELLAKFYGSQLIIDNTQAFYAKPIPGIDTFYSCRKFFGVPDGAYLYTDQSLNIQLEQDQSFGRVSHLVKRIDLSPEEGFCDFHQNDKALSNLPIRRMSKLTERMMQSIDYKAVAQQRRANYRLLDVALRHDNDIVLPLEETAVPMVYPFLVPNKGLRDKLIENKIFVVRYWSNVLDWTKPDDIDYLLVSQMQPLPIDQRYGEEEMRFIINIIKKF